jgi:hypothetical protein
LEVKRSHQSLQTGRTQLPMIPTARGYSAVSWTNTIAKRNKPCVVRYILSVPSSFYCIKHCHAWQMKQIHHRTGLKLATFRHTRQLSKPRKTTTRSTEMGPLPMAPCMPLSEAITHMKGRKDNAARWILLFKGTALSTQVMLCLLVAMSLSRCMVHATYRIVRF